MIMLAQSLTGPGAEGAATSTNDPLVTEAISMTYTEIIAPYMGVFFTAFFVTLIVTPIMRLLATRNGIVDWPDLKRKNHIEPIPYLGGVAILLGWLAAVGLCYFTVPHTAISGYGLSYVSFPISILLGAGAITITGLFDDVYGISPRVKVGGQMFAAAALAMDDVGLSLVEKSFGVVGLELPATVIYVLGTIIIAVFVVGGCNAMNLLDGLDGLAAGVGAIACGGFLVIAATAATRHGAMGGLTTDPVRIVMCLAVIGTLLGFLAYNFNPASIFMGDAGSLLLGYLCVSTILLFGHGLENPLLYVTACLIVFALPITDTSLAIFRRKMRGQPMFSPDNQHIHHLLRRSGLSVKRAVGVMYLIALVFAVLGCTMVMLELRWRYVLAVFAVLYGFIMVTSYKVGHRQIVLEKLRKQGEEPIDDTRPPVPDTDGPGDRQSRRLTPK